MATVVEVLRLPRGATSTSADRVVIAASVRTGSISERVPMAVVFPAPNPPPTTILTGTGGGRSAVSGAAENISAEDVEGQAGEGSVIAVRGSRGNRRRGPARLDAWRVRPGSG